MLSYPNRQVGRLYVIKEILAYLRPIRYILQGLLKEQVVGEYQAERLRKSATTAEELDATFFELLPLAPGQSFKERKNPKTGVEEVRIKWLYYPANYDQWRPKVQVDDMLAKKSQSSWAAMTSQQQQKNARSDLQLYL
jgi:hypothetical protein